MAASTLEFVSQAVRSAVECSITELRSLPELRDISALEAVREIERICTDAGIDCFPSLRTGELDDRRVFAAARAGDEFQIALEESLRLGEGHKVEFKQTLGLHVKRLEKDKNAPPAELFSDEIVHEVVKTIISFLNADGGVLVIGVCDDGSPYGIEKEFGFIGGGATLDQWELRLNSALQSFISDYRLVVGYFRYAIAEMDGCKVCVFKIEPRRDRITVCQKSAKEGADEIVYRRAGNRTLKLQAREIEALVLDRIRLRDRAA